MASIVCESDRLYNTSQGGCQMHYSVTEKDGLQPHWTTEETRNLTARLITQITTREEEISSLKIALDTVQNQCLHSGAEEYRNHRVGTCSICEKPFMTKQAVDAVFSDVR
ncbi:MAG: hypothetical protein A2665_01910 [Candidatus Zambryskibacteria bacterium RIFCSPHIGHO2_01_FULL_46_30]|uniref:Uncharacterized protein n=1 Tax=Candidatus Zambryskibacteria bacterium RIFCSPHIGHO2_01_FULL_46_30 TaxID=1802739 RepID=A0A1G2T347_9BACT|nr:MAG: hypothetical protein UY47_C0012G0011 [Parcubacteria group bacterium GW2011_GWB1_49_7]OHA91684.1 MAG: hypothetical protein A2665_01910 [Candidatus Zambryskibacteria bacterium RIFCSPHIGHO2_01_FULL_46_30]OHB06664.1 MAG: hypothetical protein A3B22_00925 [Candidatus Zambryskibacteria bacterium RIFCSPLOWO2_01_FULL_47_33]